MEGDFHWAAADFAVDDEIGAAFGSVQRRDESLVAVRAGDPQRVDEGSNFWLRAHGPNLLANCREYQRLIPSAVLGAAMLLYPFREAPVKQIERGLAEHKQASA